ncbi:hypothetical protein PENTCL1PPCAC_26238, partial [Pristionchus entomophagus]
LQPRPSLIVEQRMQGFLDELLNTSRAHDRLRSSMFAPTPSDRFDLDRVFFEPSRISRSWGNMLEEENHTLIMARAPPACILNGMWKWWHLTDCIYALEYMRTFPFFEGLSRKDKRLMGINLSSDCAHLTRAFFSTEQR